jgi:GT2 family glycosyltransferase
LTRGLINAPPSSRTVARACVIIPSVDNAEELGVVLDGLERQTYEDLEVVIVGPKDDSARKVAEGRGVRFIDDKGSMTRADACNVAIGETESELVIFTDDDVIVPEEWVERLVRCFDREEVSGVGGPNFAPVDESNTWQRAIDIAFSNVYLTAGTNYGRKTGDNLEEVDQLPGVNSAYRREVLEDVGGFDSGAIGAEDVMLDHRIREEGHRLWSDGSNIMWHRRRSISRVRKQIQNYGLVRALAGRRYPSLWGWSHAMVSFFPLLVTMSVIGFAWGCASGGLAWPEFWDISTEAVPIGPERMAVHQLPTLVLIFNLVAWAGAYRGPSPSKGGLTILLSSAVSFLLLWDYGIGVLKARWGIITGSSASQIDDRDRGIRE